MKTEFKCDKCKIKFKCVNSPYFDCSACIKDEDSEENK